MFKLLGRGITAMVRKVLAKFGLALSSDLVTVRSERDQILAERDQVLAERDQARSERDQARSERDQALIHQANIEAGKYDRLAAALDVARSERTAFLEQRDQAYGEVDDLCRERAQLTAEVERLKRQLETPGDGSGGA
jgi:uncharacterized protein (DUF3084 family)